MSSDYCPRCSGVLFMTSAADVWKAQCQKCHRVWELDDNLEPIVVSRWWAVVLTVAFVLAVMVEVPH